jgi:steroid delta-isomerase-like uncharacterized protein
MLNKDAIMRFTERFNQMFDGPQLEIADEIFAADLVDHLPLTPDLDREAFKAYVAGFYVGSSDLKQHIDEVIVGEDRLVLRVHYTGTHDGPMFGVPATGRALNMNGIGIFRFNSEGQVAENWAVIDVAGLLAQIGALPVA